MSVQNFLNYEAYIKQQDKQLKIWGQPCSCYRPSRKIALGYENTNPSEIDNMDTDKALGNTYSRSEARIWINFTIEKRVFYKYNWFPEDGEELCLAFMNSDADIKENDYIRTAVPQCTSIWGDMIFEVKKIIDTGLAQVLQRAYFLKPTGNADLNKELSF